MIYLLDTSAVLIHYRQEPGCERVLSLFDDPTNEVLVCSISLAECGRVLRRTGLNPAEVDAIIEAYLPLFSEVVPVDDGDGDGDRKSNRTGGHGRLRRG